VTFEAIEADGVEQFLQQLQDELVTRTYHPMRLRQKAIPKEGGTKVRVLSIPTIRDRVVQGAFKLILEPIFEADFQPGSYGYRPKRSAHDAVLRVAEAIVKYKTRVIDVDLQAYFDNIRHHLLLAQVAQRVNDPDVLHVLKDEGTTMRVLVVSMYPEDQYAIRALRAGAFGYVNKGGDPQLIVQAVRTVAQGRKYVTPEIAQMLVESLTTPTAENPHQKLSDRELQTLVLIASGKRLSDIAEALMLSPKTVSVYCARALEKLQLANNSELTVYAIRNGLVGQ